MKNYLKEVEDFSYKQDSELNQAWSGWPILYLVSKIDELIKEVKKISNKNGKKRK